MALTVGELVAYLHLDDKQFHSSLGTSKQKFEGFGGDLVGMASKFAVAIGAALVLTGVVAGFVGATKAAANYQSQITTLITGAGEFEKNRKVVGDGLLKMAGEVGVSAGALAKGMFMIESAGYHGAEALNVMKMAAEGAKVGNADMEVTANAVTTVLKDYHMGAMGAANATNFLVSVVSQGKVHMQDLADSMATILPLASSLHIPLAQVGGAMATMTSKGISADKAATYLRFSILALANETPKGTEALASIGLKADDVAAQLQKGGLLPVLQTIQEHLNKKFPQGGQEAFKTLANLAGGARGLGAALQLTGQNLDDFVAATANVSSQVAGAHGKILGWANVQADFNQKMDEAKFTLESAGIAIGEKLLPYATRLLDTITPMIPKVVDWANQMADRLVPQIVLFAKWLQSLGPDLKAAYGFIRDMAPYVLIVGGAWVAWNVAMAVTNTLRMAILAWQIAAGIVAIVTQVGIATVAQWAWNVAMDANPIGVVIVLLAALALGLKYAYDHSTWFKEKIDGLWGVLQAFGGWLGDTFGPILSGIASWLSTMADDANAVAAAIHSVIGAKGGGTGVTRNGRGWDDTTGPGPTGQAMGGDVSGGMSFIVGERGPERFTPRGSGTITPNSRLGEGSTNVTVYAQTDADPYAIAGQVGWEVRKLRRR